jgi:hypothetical protein
VISFKAPDLCQGADEDLLLVMGDIIDPGFLRRQEGESGLWRCVEGTAPDDASRADADARFRILLGVLRAWRFGAGELADERRGGMGQGGAARDAEGRQWIVVGPARIYVIPGGEDRSYARKAKAAIDQSEELRKALQLNGRANRDAAELYSIYEFAKRDLGGKEGIEAKLDISPTEQKKFTQSANWLPAEDGGRHVGDQKLTPWTLTQQEEFVTDLLQRWINYRAKN